MVNHLKNNDAQQTVAARAYGEHVVAGTLAWSIPGSPVVIRQVLGKGNWKGIKSAWYKGLNVPETDYLFQNGTQTDSGSYFDTDKPHTGWVMADASLPSAADPDTETNPPTEWSSICECQLCPDFDHVGNQIDSVGTVVAGPDEDLDPTQFFYTKNPARVRLDMMLSVGIARDKINWGTWIACRNFYDETEANDYTTLPNFDGIGLTGRYYSGSNFGELKWKRVDPVIEFPSSLGAPAVGLPVDDFSATWTGFIKAKYSEEYTFYVTHDNGVRFTFNSTEVLNIWEDDGSSAFGTDSFSTGKALDADHFYPVTFDWNEGGSGAAEFRLEWESEHSQPREVIPTKYLYPEAEDRPIYEANVSFSQPTTLDDALAWIDGGSKMVVQKIDGLYEFYCVEQMTTSFDFDLDLTGTDQQIDPKTFTFRRADRRIAEIQNVQQIKFKNLLSQYLEEPENALSLTIDGLIAVAGGREIDGPVLDFFPGDKSFNMTPWQAWKILNYSVDRRLNKDLLSKFTANALAYQVVKDDLVTLSSAAYAWDAKEFQVIEAADESPESTGEDRRFILQEL